MQQCSATLNKKYRHKHRQATVRLRPLGKISSKVTNGGSFPSIAQHEQQSHLQRVVTVCHAQRTWYLLTRWCAEGLRRPMRRLQIHVAEAPRALLLYHSHSIAYPRYAETRDTRPAESRDIRWRNALGNMLYERFNGSLITGSRLCSFAAQT